MIPAVGYIIPGTMGEKLTNDYLSQRKQLNKEEIIKHENLQKLFGYLPIVGMVTGLLRLDNEKKLKWRTYSKDNLPNRVWHVVRAFFEILCLGILYLIPDIVMTAYYARSPKFVKNDNMNSAQGSNLK